MDSSFLHGVLALAGWVLDWHTGVVVLGLLVAVVAVYVHLSGRITAVERQLRRQSGRMIAQTSQPELATGSVVEQAPTTEPVSSSAMTAGVDVATTVDPWHEGATAVTEPFETPGVALTANSAEQPVQPAQSNTFRPGSGPITGTQPSHSTCLTGGLFSSGNWLVRSGLLVLFVGVGFLLKFAAEHSVFPVPLRLAGVAGAGLAMVIVGLRLAAVRRAYALALQGGGVGLIYLTLYASFALYHLLGAGMAFFCLSLVVVLAGWLAHRQQAQVLAVFAAIGGFSAPLLASTGTGSHVLLFAYYALLNVGVLGLALAHTWRGLNLSGFVATFAFSAVWGHQFYKAEYFSTVEPFLVLFFAMYLGIAIAFAALRSLRLQDPIDGTLIFGTPLVVFGLQSRLLDETGHGLSVTAVCLALVYAFAAWFLARCLNHRLSVLAEVFTALAIGFATLAVPLAFDARWSSAAWALEGAALLWVGWRQNRPFARASGALLQLLAGLAFVEHSVTSSGWHSGDWLGTVMLAVAGMLSSVVVYRSTDEETAPDMQLLRISLGVWGLLWWFGGGFVQIDQHASQASSIGVLLLFTAISALALEWLGARLHWSLGRDAVSCLPVLLTFVAFTAWLAVEHPLSDMAALGWPFAVCAFVFILRLRGDRRSWLDDAAHLLLFWLTAGLLSWEIAWQSVRWLPALDSWLGAVWLAGPSAALVWLLRAKQRAAWPVATREALYLSTGCGPIVLALSLGVFVLSVSDPGTAWPIMYLPMLNPLDLLSAAALGVMMKWWEAAATSRSGVWRATAVVGIGLVFVWLNGLLLRTLHFHAGVPWELSAQLSSALVQASLSVLWACTALLAMVFGSRMLRRGVWMTGAGLMLAVIGKLLLVDLSSTGTIARIVSFICVGLLLMLVGYLAPVPPRREELAGESAA